MGAGVACPRCGASTPLPDDLRVATFSCHACHTTLETASFAGPEATSADAVLGFTRAVVGQPFDPSSLATAPRFDGGSRDHREMPCKRCGEPVSVPLDLRAREVRCEACDRRWPVAAYISDVERLQLDMARQVAGNDALRRLVAEGLDCGACGGHNEVPDDDSVQLTCAFCGATLLLADHVDASAVARRRLKEGVFGLRDEAMRQHEAHQRRERWIAALVVGAIALVIAGIAAASALAGLLAAVTGG